MRWTKPIFAKHQFRLSCLPVADLLSRVSIPRTVLPLKGVLDVKNKSCPICSLTVLYGQALLFEYFPWASSTGHFVLCKHLSFPLARDRVQCSPFCLRCPPKFWFLPQNMQTFLEINSEVIVFLTQMSIFELVWFLLCWPWWVFLHFVQSLW